MKVILNEKQLNRLFLSEAPNVAFNRSKTNGDNMKAIWAEIERKQKILQANVFGDLSEKLYDITMEKAKVMGNEHLRIPDTICNAGNSKLPENVLIINMSSSLMCPSYYLGICTIKDGACYAQKGENQHTNNVLPNRWQTDLMHTQMLQQYKKGNKTPMKEYFRIIEMYIQLANAYSTNLYKKELERMTEKYRRQYGRDLTKEEKELLKVQQDNCKITDVRLNETGDFQCQLAVNLWANFAKKIKKKYGISTHAYTARNLDFSEASKYMAINPSHKGINLGNSLERMFKAIDDKTYKSLEWCKVGYDRQPELKTDKRGILYYKCPCGDNETYCDRCGVCFEPNKTGKPYTIYVKYHGLTAANGLKALFKKEEISNVIEKLYTNGWITDEEYQSYNSEANQKKLDKMSKNITALRKADVKNKAKTKKK